MLLSNRCLGRPLLSRLARLAQRLAALASAVAHPPIFSSLPSGTKYATATAAPSAINAPRAEAAANFIRFWLASQGSFPPDCSCQCGGRFDTLNIVYAEEEERGFIKLNAISLTFTAAAVAFILVAIAAVAVLPVALTYLGLTDFTDFLLRIARWPALALGLAVALALIYRFGPSRAAPQWRWISWGSVAAALLWLAGSALFSFYAANFGNFNLTYGSLGAVIGFMTWLWISAIVILLGAELNAEIEH